MYTVSSKKKCEAKHFLPNQDGREEKEHSHAYLIEARVSGENLDTNGYLIDITEIESILNELANRFEDETLNNLPEFDNLNPTVENFSKVVWEKTKSKLKSKNISLLEIRVWEKDDTYASYKGELEI